MSTIFSSATWDADELTCLGQLRVAPETFDGENTSRLVFHVKEGPYRAARAIDFQEIRDLHKALGEFIESESGR